MYLNLVGESKEVTSTWQFLSARLLVARASGVLALCLELALIIGVTCLGEYAMTFASLVSLCIRVGTGTLESRRRSNREL